MCWRTHQPAPSPKKAYEKIATRDDADSFLDVARWVGLPAARAYVADPTPQAFAALTAAVSGDAQTQPAPSTASTAAAGTTVDPATLDDRHLVGVSFADLWQRFLKGQRHHEEGTVELHEGYGRHHLLPFLGDVDLGLVARTQPLRTSHAIPGAVYVDDDWPTHMMAKPRLNNVARPIEGTVLSLTSIDNVLTVLGQCFDLAVRERPALLEVNPARDIRLPRQDRRKMHFLEDEQGYRTLRTAIDGHWIRCTCCECMSNVPSKHLVG